jgi:general stress protein 26
MLEKTTMARQASDAQAAEKLWSLIEDFPVAMLTTLDDNGFLHSRPMATLPEAGFADASLWFFTHTGSAKTHELDRHWRVNLAFSDHSRHSYVSVGGIAELVRDREMAHRLWDARFTPWFPGGPDDPGLTLMKVTVDQAEYWDAAASGMAWVYGYMKARLTDGPQPGASNAKVSFQQPPT